MGINNLCTNAPLDYNPIRIIKEFLETQKRIEETGDYENWRFVGYVLELEYDKATIITSDPYKLIVGGIPRNSLLIMIPNSFEDVPPHFTLLRVLEAAPTPLSKEVQQTYFELQKRSMPELDVFTQSELQWGALKAEVLGMFYPNPDNKEKIEFSGDINNFLSAHKYKLFSPDENVLDLIINSMVPKENCFPIGDLRLTECRLLLPKNNTQKVYVNVSTADFMGTRTALFGKTRLGKSNVVKLIAQSIIETTSNLKNVGQIIFDINGEYANDNPQDDNTSLKSVYKDSCEVFAFRPRDSSNVHVLKINFYEHPERSHSILADLIQKDKRSSIYIKSFINVEIPSIESLSEIDNKGDQIRAIRRILIFWAVLKKAGFSANEKALKDRLNIKVNRNSKSIFDPCYRKELREEIYGKEQLLDIENLDNLVNEYVKLAEYIRSPACNKDLLISAESKKPLFDEDDEALLGFLKPAVGAGPKILSPFRPYHDISAKNVFEEIINFINEGKTVILDLGNVDPSIMQYYSEELSWDIFNSQMQKFTSNNLNNNYVQMYFEEAHNLFPQNDDVTGIYARLAKEGAKYHIGMVYSTQSPSTINKDLLAQTENFFIAHMSSRDEVKVLAKLNVAYENIQDDILQAKTPGYIRMLTRSNRFVVPLQARKFSPINSKGE